MYITRFGGYALPEQLDMQESGGLERQASTQPLAGAGGSLDDYGVGPDPLAEDSISKSFIVQAASSAALQTAIDALIGEMMLSQSDWRQGARLLVATLPDGSQRCTWAKCAGVRWNQEAYHFDQGWLGAIEITWRRSAPQWWTLGDLLVLGDHHTLADTAGYTFGQNVTAQALTGTSTTFTITHGGNARVITGLIEFDGAVNTPTVRNLRNGHWFTYNGTLVAGDRLTLDIATLLAKKNGVSGQWSNLTLGTDNGQLMPFALEPGANPIEITCLSEAATFRFYWGRAWA
jgi:hypothetical protein